MKKLIIFDLDGTLIDSVHDLADAVNISLKRMGYPTHDVSKYYGFIGDGTVRLCERALPSDKRDYETIQRLHTMFADEYSKCCLNKTQPFDGVVQMLEELKSYGYMCAVASNKTDEFAKMIVTNLFGEKTFEVIYGKRLGKPTKPNPEIVQNIADELQVDLSKCIFAGDSDVDVYTAHNAGIECIGCTWGFRSAEELISAKTDYLVDKPIDILKYL